MSDNDEDVTRGELFGFLKASLQGLSEDITEVKVSLTELKDDHLQLKQEVEKYKIKGETVLRIATWLVGLLVGLASILGLSTLKAIFHDMFGGK